MLGRKALFAAAGAAALLTTSLVTAPAAEARCSRDYFTGEASGPRPLRAITGVAARAEWRKEVTRELGAEYALWSRSQNRITRCVIIRGESGWRCTARARPCNTR